MTYNLSYLYASLTFMLLILFHNISLKRRSIMSGNLFLYFLVICMLDVSLDIITSLLIDYHNPNYNIILTVLLTAFYILQVLLLFLFYIYSQQVREIDEEIKAKNIHIGLIPNLLMSISILSTPFTRLYFYFDNTGNYIHGPLYLLMYIYSCAFILIIVTSVIYNHHQYGRKNTFVFCAYMVILASTIILQAIYQKIMFIGFGYGLGIVLMYITISDPSRDYDSLTQAYNLQSLISWVDNHRLKKDTYYYVIVEISSLSYINKIYGGMAGDYLLRKISAILTDKVNRNYVFRSSGNQMIAITYDKVLADRAIDFLYETFKTPVKVANATIRCPIVLASTSSLKIDNSAALLSYCNYINNLSSDKFTTMIINEDDNFNSGFLQQEEIERFLSLAIEKDLFEIALQPIYDIRKQKINSVEVLSRLVHPKLGMISPDKFISIAERNGNIDAITELQFRRLCTFINQHPEIISKLDSIKFNLSPHDLIVHKFAEVIPQIIKEYDLPYTIFEFEITESAAIEFSDSLNSAITSFKEKGIRICMDDFGSGYANLSSVLKLPFSHIKIDQSLLTNITTEPSSALFYQCIINDMHLLNYEVVSEGVETEQQLNLLKQWGSDYIQGYYFSRPLKPDDFIKFLENNN